MKKEEIKVILDKIREILDSNYVYPDIATKMNNNFQDHYEKGSYDDIEDLEALAPTILAHMEEIVVDKHNRVLVRNETSKMLFDMADQMEDLGGNIPTGPVRKVVKMSKGPSENDGQMKPVRKMMGGPVNKKSGIEEAKTISNNIGYLKLSMFNSTMSPDGEAMIQAMKELSETDAFILDLRQCKGGDGSMVHLVQNFFFGWEEGDEDIQIIEHYFRPMDEIMKRFAKPYEGKTYKGKPVYILTSKKTGSAAEDMTFSMQNHKRAVIIGETTAGAGHPTSFHKLSDNLLFMCSIARAYDPLTNMGWESTGVAPDIIVPSEDALEKAIEIINSARN
jgi:hypothetical protein